MICEMESDTMNKRKRLLALLINGVLLSSLSCVAMAAPDTSIGTGNGVAYGTGSKAPEFKNIAIGNDAEVYYANGTNRPATGDIAIGSGHILITMLTKVVA